MVNCIFNDIFIYWSLIYTHVFYDEFADRFFSVKKKKKHLTQQIGEILIPKMTRVCLLRSPLNKHLFGSISLRQIPLKYTCKTRTKVAFENDKYNSRALACNVNKKHVPTYLLTFSLRSRRRRLLSGFLSQIVGTKPRRSVRREPST